MNHRTPNASKIVIKNPLILTSNYESDGKDNSIKIDLTKKIVREATKKYFYIK